MYILYVVNFSLFPKASRAPFDLFILFLCVAYLAGGFDSLDETQHDNAPGDEEAQREVPFDGTQIFDTTR